MQSEKESRLVHIEGLRGIAILYVVLFHAYMQDFALGFVGVDIFFVISGYFLFKTKDFQAGILEGSRRFLLKKVARLGVPVCLLVLMTSVAGIFLALPREFENSLSTGLYTLLGVSNIYLSTSSKAYFSPDIAYNPLMHMWYIGVLVQVYALFVLGSILLRRLPKLPRLLILALVFLVSLFCAKYEILINFKILPKTLSLPFDYYSTTTRLWEVLAGGAVALLPGRGKQSFSWMKLTIALALLAIIILLPIFGSSGERNGLPIAIVAATVLYIAYGRSAFEKIAALKPLRSLGKISFSLYLVHMPVLAFYRAMPKGNVYTDIVVGAIIIGAGVLFYIFVERRRFFPLTTLLFWCASLITGAVLSWCVPGSFLWKSAYAHYTPYAGWTKCSNEACYDGLDSNELKPYFGTAWMSQSKDAADVSRKLPIRWELLLCVGHEGNENFLLIGDSYASMLYSGLHEMCKEQGLHGLYLQTYMIPFCGWKRVDDRSNLKCSPRCEALVAWLKRQPRLKKVIIAQSWVSRINAHTIAREKDGRLSKEQGLELFLTKLKECGCDVLVIAQPLTFRGVKSKPGIQMTSFDDLVCSRQEYDSVVKGAHGILNRLEAKGLCHVLHMEDALYDGGQMRTRENGEYVMFDIGHLSPYGAAKAVQASKNAWIRWLASKPGPEQ